MSQEFSFPNLFIGLLRLTSSRAVHDPEAVQDPKLIARFIHQMTGNENQYVPPPPAAAQISMLIHCGSSPNLHCHRQGRERKLQLQKNRK